MADQRIAYVSIAPEVLHARIEGWVLCRTNLKECKVLEVRWDAQTRCYQALLESETLPVVRSMDEIPVPHEYKIKGFDDA